MTIAFADVVACVSQSEELGIKFTKFTCQSYCLRVKTINLQCEQLRSLLLSCAIPEMLDL